jgi:hypothetical protein
MEGRLKSSHATWAPPKRGRPPYRDRGKRSIEERPRKRVSQRKDAGRFVGCPTGKGSTGKTQITIKTI